MTLQRILSSTALLLVLSLSGCGSSSGNGSGGGTTDIYIAGAIGIATGFNADESIATYWKNGAATNLTDGTTQAGANAIAVDNSGNVFIAGSTSTASSDSIATYWKNGTATNLPNGAACGFCAMASGIALSSH